MFLKGDFLSLLSTSSSSPQWICNACLRRSHLQLRKASTTSRKTKTPPQPQDYTPQIYQHKLPEPKVHKPAQFNPNGKLTRGEIADLKRPPLPYLNHLIGSNHPPKPGQNPAIDRRSFAQRVHEYWTREAYDERTRKINVELKRGYYQDWHLIRRRKGKTWVAPNQPFLARVAKYFPNFQGYTHADQWTYVDTTKLLLGRISIVCFVREQWSGRQAESFVSHAANPELAALVDGDYGGVGLQRVWVNYEDEWMKAVVIYLFYWWAKRRAGGDAATSMVVTRGVEREFVENELGIKNLRVGHVFLVDALCRIRWVGNGDAYEEERGSIVKVVKELVRERQVALERLKTPLVKRTVERENRSPRPLAAMMMQ